MKETSQQRYRRRRGTTQNTQSKQAKERRKSEGVGSGKIYNTPRRAVFCNRCKEPCGMYPAGKAGIPKLVCSTCKVKAKRLPKKYCNLCGTDRSLEWHTWKRMHLCRPCNIEQQRIYPEHRSRQSHLTHEDIDGGLALLQFLKDSGEL